MNLPKQIESHHPQEDGVAIILAMLFVVITSGMVASGSLLMKATSDRAAVSFRREAQATQFARSGLTESLSWLRRQTGQPVTDFDPQLNASAIPALLDTDDPVIGLVREFQIADDIWGRYEVWRKDEADTDLIRLDFRRKYQCEDLSVERGHGGAGHVWLLRCLGFVFQKRDTTKAWNELPNRVLSMSTLECEVQRLALQPPGQAAICLPRGSDCQVLNQGRVRGSATGAGIYYAIGTGAPTISGSVTGNPSISATGSYNGGIRDVFSVSENELRSMADLVITTATDLPNPVPTNSIIFVDTGGISFDATRSLNGTGIIYFKGDVKLLAGNNSSFNGLVFVDGDVSMEQTADIYGALVCTGSVTLQGSGDYASVWYDDAVLAGLRTQIGQYRWSGAFRTVLNQE